MVQTKKTTAKSADKSIKKTTTKKVATAKVTKKTIKPKTTTKKVVEKVVETVTPVVDAVVDKIGDVTTPIIDQVDDIKLDDIDLSKENTLTSDDVSLQSDIDLSNDTPNDDVVLPEISLDDQSSDNNTEITIEWSESMDLWSNTSSSSEDIITPEVKSNDNWSDPFEWLNIDDVANYTPPQEILAVSNLDASTSDSNSISLDDITAPVVDTDQTLDSLSWLENTAVIDPFVWDTATSSQEANISIDDLMNQSTDQSVIEDQIVPQELSTATDSATITDSPVQLDISSDDTVMTAPVVSEVMQSTVSPAIDDINISTQNQTSVSIDNPDTLLNQLSTNTTVVDTVTGMNKTKKLIVIWSILTWLILLGISAYVVISTFRPSDFTDDINANLLGVASWDNLLWLDLTGSVNQLPADPGVDQFGNPIILDPATDVVVDTDTWSTWADTSDTNTQENSLDDMYLTPTDDFWSEDELTLDDIAQIDTQPTDTSALNNTTNNDQSSTNTSNTTTTDTVDGNSEVDTIWATSDQIKEVQDNIITSLDEVKQLLTIAKEKNDTQVMRLLAIILTQYRDLNIGIEDWTFSNFSEIETKMSEITYLLDKAKSYIIQ